MLSPPRILLVEDTPELREDLALELADAGYHVIEAGDAKSAVSAFEAERPDFVICDVQLPDTDGLSVVATIRAGGPGKGETPVIVMSAFSDQALRLEAEALGIECFIVKPVDYARLIELLETRFRTAGSV